MSCVGHCFSVWTVSSRSLLDLCFPLLLLALCNIPVALSLFLFWHCDTTIQYRPVMFKRHLKCASSILHCSCSVFQYFGGILFCAHCFVFLCHPVISKFAFHNFQVMTFDFP